VALWLCKLIAVSATEQQLAETWANPGIGNLDPALMNFLKKFFPHEVKVKQKENERSLGVDQYGKEYSRCSVM